MVLIVTVLFFPPGYGVAIGSGMFVGTWIVLNTSA